MVARRRNTEKVRSHFFRKPRLTLLTSLVLVFLFLSNASLLLASVSCGSLLDLLRAGQLQQRLEKVRSTLLPKKIVWSDLDFSSPEVKALVDYTMSKDPVDVAVEKYSVDESVALARARLGRDEKNIRAALVVARSLGDDIANFWLANSPKEVRSLLDEALSREIAAQSVAPPFPKQGPLEDIVVVTHQKANLQEKTGRFLAANKKLKSAPRMGLVTPEFRFSSPEYTRQLSDARYSIHGRAPDVPLAKRVHLMGGNLETCLADTVGDLVMKYVGEKNAPAKELQFFIYSDLTYTGTSTLSNLLKKRGIDATDDLHDIIESDVLTPDTLNAIGLRRYVPPKARGEKRKRVARDFYYIHEATGQIIHFHIL